MSRLIVSLHDVAPATAAVSRWWVDRLDELGLKSTILVIPGPWRGESMSMRDPLGTELRRWSSAGHEIALHGWTHSQGPDGGRYARVVARGAGEFAGLGASESADRVHRGLVVLGSNGIETRGFTPPGWLISDDAKETLTDLGITYYTTRGGVVDLVKRHTFRIPVVCHRPGSPITGLGAAVVRVGGRQAMRLGRDLRVAIHPDDSADPRLVEATLELLEAASGDPGVRPGPYRDFLEAA